MLHLAPPYTGRRRRYWKDRSNATLKQNTKCRGCAEEPPTSWESDGYLGDPAEGDAQNSIIPVKGFRLTEDAYGSPGG